MKKVAEALNIGIATLYRKVKNSTLKVNSIEKEVTFL